MQRGGDQSAHQADRLQSLQIVAATNSAARNDCKSRMPAQYLSAEILCADSAAETDIRHVKNDQPLAAGFDDPLCNGQWFGGIPCSGATQELSITEIEREDGAVGTKLIDDVAPGRQAANGLRADDNACDVLGEFYGVARVVNPGVEPQRKAGIVESAKVVVGQSGARAVNRVEIGDIKFAVTKSRTNGLGHCEGIGRIGNLAGQRPILVTPASDAVDDDLTANVQCRYQSHGKKLRQSDWKADSDSLKFFDRLSSRDSIDVSPRIPSRGRQSGLRVVFTPNPAWQGRRAVRGDCSG